MKYILEKPDHCYNWFLFNYDKTLCVGTLDEIVAWIKEDQGQPQYTNGWKEE